MPVADVISIPSRSPQRPNGGPESTNIMDTEMTCPLTPNDEEKSIQMAPPYYTGSNSHTHSHHPRGPTHSTTEPSMGHNPAWNQPLPQGFYPPPVQQPSDEYVPYPYLSSDPSAPIISPLPPNPLYTTPQGHPHSTYNNQEQVLLSAVSPGPVYPTEQQLDTAYGYGVRREDGGYTRLIRADRTSGTHNAVQQGPEGLIILPEPRQPSPTRRQGPMPLVPGDVVASLPSLDVEPYGRYHNQPPRYENQVYSQQNFGTFLTSPPVRPLPRKEKIYCDKWIHEGVCAFTQMGCKYKHEMPSDKATQMSLGLNQGLPTWYRRAHGVHLNSPPVAEVPQLTSSASQSGASSNHSRVLSGNWRRHEQSVTSPTPGTNIKVLAGPPGTGPGSRNAFGPIGPPPSQPNFTNNPYSSLKIEEHSGLDDEEDDDTITWKGRNH